MDSSEPVEGDIRGVISVQADTFKGFMLVGFPEPTYVAILSKMFGEKYTKISPELRDGAGEFANMIFGYAKRVLTEQGKKVEMARPEVLLGTTGPSGSSASRVSIEFKSEIGPVFLELRELV
jgi:CheY-specific phosphatase CheX